MAGCSLTGRTRRGAPTRPSVDSPHVVAARRQDRSGALTAPVVCVSVRVRRSERVSRSLTNNNQENPGTGGRLNVLRSRPRVTPHFDKKLFEGDSNPPFPYLRFLVVDDSANGRFLLSQTLQRKFPRAAVADCRAAEEAFRFLEDYPVNLTVVHHTSDADALALVRELRRRRPALLVLLMSAANLNDEALAAGADGFLPYDEWLMVGNHAVALLRLPSAVAAGS